MLTKVRVEKTGTNSVSIGLTDHADSIYRETLYMVSDMVNIGLKIVEVNPYGKIVIETKDFKKIQSYVKKYLDNNDIIDFTEQGENFVNYFLA